MRCDVCRGACCESISIGIKYDTDDLQNFLELRTKPIVQDGEVRRNFECRCRMLTPEGRCAIYHTPAKPKLCTDYQPGSSYCLATVRARRSEAEFEAIREAGDPHWDGRQPDVVMTGEAFAAALQAMTVTPTVPTPFVIEVPCADF